MEEEPQAPEVVAVRAATAYHEAIEALRWARELVSSGTATPAEIAIASVWPAEYDDHLLALRRGREHRPPLRAWGEDHRLSGRTSRRGARGTCCSKVCRRTACDDSPRCSRSIPVPSRRSRRAGSALCLPMHRSLLLKHGSDCSIGLGPEDWPDGNDHGLVRLARAALVTSPCSRRLEVISGAMRKRSNTEGSRSLHRPGRTFSAARRFKTSSRSPEFSPISETRSRSGHCYVVRS